MRLLREVLPAALVVAMAVCQLPATAGAATSTRLSIDFQQGDPLTPGTVVRDTSGLGNHGVVRTKHRGRIVPDGGAARFPRLCTSEPCPNAMIKIPSSPSLNPGRADFEWGATVTLRASDTADGENVVQKGRWGDATGMWKLQVDKLPARPSCTVSGQTSSSAQWTLAIATSSIGVADGVPHQITCRRTADAVEIYVDGVRTGAAAAPVVSLGGSAPVTIGAKEVASLDNDQFQGTLDDVFMRVD